MNIREKAVTTILQRFNKQFSINIESFSVQYFRTITLHSYPEDNETLFQVHMDTVVDQTFSDLKEALYCFIDFVTNEDLEIMLEFLESN